MHVQIWIGLMVEVKTVHAENGQDGSCVCRGLQVEEIWVRSMGLISRGEILVAKGNGKGCGH